MTTKIKITGYGWYSAEMYDHSGAALYENEHGNPVPVTYFTRTKKKPTTGWTDIIFVGPVGNFLDSTNDSWDYDSWEP